MSPASVLACWGCGTRLGLDEPYPFTCPEARVGDDTDHVLRRHLNHASVRFPAEADEPNPFLRYRILLHPYHVARAGGLSDAAFCALVSDLDARVAAVDGQGFRATPFARSDDLSAGLGFSAQGGVWVKDETGNVSGSHKARHLFDVLLQIEVAERLGLVDRDRPRRLAIASCGNAALAAAVLAAASGRSLDVYVPADADPAVTSRLIDLGAVITTCDRDGLPGDPTYRRLLTEIAAGALPFTCQGNLNGLAVEGGMTLGYELAAAGVGLDRLIVQVGGGALASACYEALEDARVLGHLVSLPHIDTVQTQGAWPLRRAFDRLVAASPDADPARALRTAAIQRGRYMWPWETEPHSLAHGIVDDETYDWVAVVEGMLATGGATLVVDEAQIAAANALAREATPIPVDPTGSAGLAGLMALHAAGGISPDERVAVLFTGLARTTDLPSIERIRHEKLSRPRHLVAQGL